MPVKKEPKYRRKSSLDNINFQYDHKKHKISFYYAIKGIGYAFSTQPNFRFHVFAFSFILILSGFFKISYIEFAILLVVSGIVFIAEMFNTALEALADEVSDGKILKLIGVSKDISAGAVLISAITAVIVGLFIFMPYLLSAF